MPGFVAISRRRNPNDDDIVDATAGIRTLQSQIEAEGCHVFRCRSCLRTLGSHPVVRRFSSWIGTSMGVLCQTLMRSANTSDGNV